MKSAPNPENESDRLQKLLDYQILDTEPEKAFDRITRIVAETINVPISLVSLVDADRQWFKSRYGLNAEQTPREIAFCSHAILGEETLVVEDTHLDDRFADNPLVTGDPSIRFYAGTPLITPDGYKLGTLCAIGPVPRKISGEHIQLIEDLASLVVDEIELRKALRKAISTAEEQNDLRQAAEAANIAKSQFLATMSHEIRTPLNAIIGLTELVLSTDLNEKQKSQLSNVMQAGKSLLGLINDILDFSKIEAGKLDTDNANFLIKDIISNLQSVAEPRAEENGNTLLIDIDSAVPDKLYGDELRIGQILTNIVGNAVKFTKDGTVTVSVSTKEHDDSQKSILFAISDTGIGMGPDQIDQLFQPFAQADQSVTREFGGTGLGLSISHKLAKLIGGKITVISEEGNGSTFTFYLPLVASKNNADISHKSKKNDTAKENTKDVVVLLVEDNELNQMVAVGILEGAGFKVELAKDGQEAVDMVRKHGETFYRSILMDVQMPKMDGLAATKFIREELGFKKLPILAMTANAMTEERKNCETAGMNDHIAKPIDTKELISKLNWWIDEYDKS